MSRLPGAISVRGGLRLLDQWGRHSDGARRPSLRTRSSSSSRAKSPRTRGPGGRVHRRRPQVRIGQDPPQGSRLPGRVTHAARLSGRPPRPQAHVTAPGHPPGLAGGLRLLTARGGPPRARPGAAPDRQRVPLGRPRRTRWARHWTTTPSAASWPPTPRVSLPVTTWCASSAGATTRSSARRALRRWTRISRRSPPASAYSESPASPRTSGWSGSRRSRRATRSSSPERQAPSAPRSARSPS